MMKKLKVKKKRNISLIWILAGIICIILVVTFSLPSFQPKIKIAQSPPTVEEIQKLYSSSDIFKNIPLKDRQIDLLKKTPKGAFYFSTKVRNDLQNTKVTPMKCMPEQIYFGKNGYNYSILSNGPLPYYTEIKIQDPKLLNVILQLERKINKYTELPLMQFLACKTGDGRYIVKYNTYPNLTNKKSPLYSYPPTEVVEITPDSLIQNPIHLAPSPTSFCETPLELTKDNIFYIDCNVQTGNSGSGVITESYVYKIALPKSDGRIISKCIYRGSNATCTSTDPCIISSDSSMWNTFESDTYSFKYPECGWDISQYQQPAGLVTSLECLLQDCGKKNFAEFTIRPLEYKNLDEYKSSISSWNISYSDLIEKKNATINGKSAIVGISDSGYSYLLYLVEHKGKVYQLEYEYRQLNLNKFSDFSTPIPNIVATFHFKD